MIPRACSIPARLAALLLLLLAVAPARAGDEPIGDGKLARARLGWEGSFPKDTVAPVTVLLTNDEMRERAIRVTVAPADSERAEASVTLAPGAKKRVTLPVRARSNVTISISEGSKLVGTQTFPVSVLPDHAVLCVDGDPDSAQLTDVATGCIVSTCRVEDVPSEVACLVRFNGIVLRLVDPSRLGEGARGALDDYVRTGGTLVVVAPRERAAMRSFFDALPVTSGGPARPTASSETGEGTAGAFPARAHGLGRVVGIERDVGESTPEAAQVRSDLGSLLLATRQPPFPCTSLGSQPNGAAMTAGAVTGAFFLLYLVVAGPVFAVVLRGKKPARVVRALAALLAGFVVLGALTAGALRDGTASVSAFSFMVLPPEGDPVVLASVALQSAGQRSQDLSIEGDDVAATSFGRAGRHVEFEPWSDERTWHTEASETTRAVGHRTVSFPSLPVPSFGEASLSVLAGTGHADVTRIEARIDTSNGKSVAVVTNTLSHDLGAVLVCGRWQRNGSWEAARAPMLKSGATVSLGLSPWPWLNAVALGLPREIALSGWLDLAPRCRDGLEARYVLYVEDSSPVVVRASGGRVIQHAWRVQAIETPPPTVPGWLGVTAKRVKTGLSIVSVAAGSPAAATGWFLCAGRIIKAVGDLPVRTEDDLRRALLLAGPGGRVKIVTDDGYSQEVDLGTRPKSAEEDEDR